MWKSKYHIRRNTLIGNEIDGGLNIIDVESKLNAFKESWIPNLLNTKSSLFCSITTFSKWKTGKFS